MHSQRTNERFKNAYWGLATLWLTGSILILTLAINVIQKQILSSRSEAVEALVSSHAKNIEVFNTRSLRDELVKRNVIESDKDFRHLVPSTEREELRLVLDSCEFLNENICAGQKRSVVLLGSTKNPLQASAALILEGSYFTDLLYFWICVIGSIFSLGIFTFLIGLGFASQEKFLKGQISILSRTLDKVARDMGLSRKDENIIEDLSHLPSSLEQFAEHYQKLNVEFLENKEWHTRHSNKELLEESIAHAHHDLKGPLQEAIDFFRHLGDMIENDSKDEILASARSLESRLTKTRIKVVHSLSIRKEKLTHSQETLRLANILSDLHQSLDLNKNQRLFVIQDPNLESIILPENHGELTRVLWNLVNNAFEASASEVTVKTRLQEDNFHIYVRDNGSGIPLELREEIFLDRVSTKTNGGGLGLSNVQRILAKLEGSIDLIVRDEGTEFRITLKIPELLGRTSGD